MVNALFAYNDVSMARNAARRLAAKLPARSVVMHAKDEPPGESLPEAADEQFSGGLLSNVFELFQGVFEWGSSPHEASDYEATVRNGGAVVSVDAKTLDQQKIADATMQDTGFTQRTSWREPS
jgi:hypothetical protein